MRHRNVAAPVAAGLLVLLPFQTVDTAQATAVLEIVAAFASSYTRGQGFTDGVPKSDGPAAILICAARLVTHPRQVGLTEVKGPESYQLYHAPVAWSLAELAVLNRYRERAH